jgi:hypothetical protein
MQQLGAQVQDLGPYQLPQQQGQLQPATITNYMYIKCRLYSHQVLGLLVLWLG